MIVRHKNTFSWTYLHFLQTLPDFQTVLRNACKAPPSPLSPRRLAATLPGHQLFEKQHHKMRTPTKTRVKLEDNMFPVGEEPSDLHANFVLVRIYKFYDNHNDKFRHFTTSWHTTSLQICSFALVRYSLLCNDRFLYVGTVKRHNVCKRHIAIDAGFKQTERTIFLHAISMGLKLYLLSSAFLKKLCQNCQ